MAREGVPVIDMQKVEGLGEELVQACEEWGCFRMVNHGVPAELMAEMKAVATTLFDLPEETKMRTVHTELGKGYIRRNLVSPFFEGLSIDEISSPGEFCDRLDASPHQREIIYKYLKALRDLAGHLGRKLMEGSGLAGDLFEGWCCQLRMNKYHYCPESVGLSGFDMHSDPTFLTILQDDENVNGLQVVDKYSGDFAPVDPLPGTLAVNVGDIAKAWSNGRYCNVKHRYGVLKPKHVTQLLCSCWDRMTRRWKRHQNSWTRNTLGFLFPLMFRNIDMFEFLKAYARVVPLSYLAPL